MASPTWIAGALALALVSCGGTPPWHGDQTFTPAERAEVEAGYAWIAARVGEDPAPIVWDAPHGDHGDGRIARVTAGFGSREEDGKVFVLVAQPEAIRAIAAHEFGHFFGLGHTETGVMRPVGASLEWTDENQRACEELGVCK